MFASSKVLSRFDIPFTYLTNCYTEDVKFENGIRNFLAAAGVAKAFNAPRIGQISVRPAAFWSVKCNEAELLERFGVEVVPLPWWKCRNAIRISFRKGTDFEEELTHIMSKVKAECVGREALESICA